MGPSPVSKHATQAGLLRNDAHAMLIGRSGDQNARWAVDHSGAMHWGNGESDIFTSTLSSRQTTTTVWPVLTLHPGEAHGAHAPLPGVMPADICTCSHDGLGEVLVQLTCHVAKPGNIYIVRTCTRIQHSHTERDVSKPDMYTEANHYFAATLMSVANECYD